jgi:hypothetical protein
LQDDQQPADRKAGGPYDLARAIAAELALRLVLNPLRKTVHFIRAFANVRRRWPELVIDNDPGSFSGVN